MQGMEVLYWSFETGCCIPCYIPDDDDDDDDVVFCLSIDCHVKQEKFWNYPRDGLREDEKARA